MGATWTRNSLQYDLSTTSSNYINANYALIVISVVILSHSFSNHKRKCNIVRLQTEAGSLSAALAGALFLLLIHYDAALSDASVFLYDFLYICLFPLVIQLCDNHMFYSRLKSVSKIPLWKQRLIHIYILTVLSLTWAPFYSIVPFFYNTNSSDLTYVYLVTLSIQVWGTVAYNFYFTIEFSIILRAISTSKAAQTTALKRTANLRAIISVKSIIHCMTSSLASLIYLYIPGVGNPIYVIIIILGMHLLFNISVESHFTAKKSFCLTLLSNNIFSTTRTAVVPCDGICDGLKRYRDVSLANGSTSSTTKHKNTRHI